MLDIQEEIKDNADLEFSSSEEPATHILVLAKAAFNFKLPVIWLEDLPPKWSVISIFEWNYWV